MGVMLVCPHDFDVALSNVIVKNIALSFSLVGQPWTKTCYLDSYFFCV